MAPQKLAVPSFAQLCAFVRAERRACPDLPIADFLMHLGERSAALRWEAPETRLWDALNALYSADRKSGRWWSFEDPHWDQPSAPPAPKPAKIEPGLRAVPGAAQTQAYLRSLRGES
jgi:hypothetical protein